MSTVDTYERGSKDMATTAKERYAELVAEYRRRGMDDSDSVPDDYDATIRYLLVERNRMGGGYYLTPCESPTQGAKAHLGNEYAEDWELEALIDLETGEEYRAEFGITWKLEPKAAPSAPEWTQADRDAAGTEGWDIYNIGVPGTVDIERIDELEIFDRDDGAWLFIGRKAQAGSDLHKRALAYMAHHSPDEYENIVLHCREYGTILAERHASQCDGQCGVEGGCLGADAGAIEP